MFKASCPGAYSHAIHLSSLHAISLPRLSWTAHTDQQIGPAVRHVRAVHTATTQAIETPFRKHLKDEAKQRKAEKRLHDNKLGDNGSSSNHERRKSDGAALDKWQLTVGLEIHAQLNTERKLFSSKPLLVFRSWLLPMLSRCKNLRQRCAQLQRFCV